MNGYANIDANSNQIVRRRGRPRKYTTEAQRAKAKKLNKDKWYRRNSKTHVVEYNRNYYMQRKASDAGRQRKMRDSKRNRSGTIKQTVVPHKSDKTDKTDKKVLNEEPKSMTQDDLEHPVKSIDRADKSDKNVQGGFDNSVKSVGQTGTDKNRRNMLAESSNKSYKPAKPSKLKTERVAVDQKGGSTCMNVMFTFAKYA
jgi:hypothetical protein